MSGGDDIQWSWDPTLFAGSAAHYPRGRVGYPAALVAGVVRALQLDGTGRLLDIGCGPGSVALLLAPHYADVVGVDADPDMIEVAGALAEELGIRNASWHHRRGEELTADLGVFRTAVLAQSFHWMDRPLVAGLVHELLEVGGTLVHIHANTNRGSADIEGLSGPQPPYDAIAELVSSYLGPLRRAGQGVLPHGTVGGEDEIYRETGFVLGEQLEVPAWVVERSVDDLVAATFSLSGSAPHLFDDRLAAFEDELRALLVEAAGDGGFTERMLPIGLDVWHRAVDLGR